MTDVLESMNSVGGEFSDSETERRLIARLAELGISEGDLVLDGISGKVGQAIDKVRPIAEVLVDALIARKAHGESLTREPFSVAVALPVDLHDNEAQPRLGIPKRTDKAEVAKWLSENIPLGDENYRWDVKSAGRDDRIYLKVVKVRKRQGE